MKDDAGTKAAWVMAAASVAVAIADLVVASRLRSPDMGGVIMAMIIFVVACAQIVPLVMSVIVGFYLRQKPVRKNRITALVLCGVLGVPVLLLGIVTALSCA